MLVSYDTIIVLNDVTLPLAIFPFVHKPMGRLNADLAERCSRLGPEWGSLRTDLPKSAG